MNLIKYCCVGAFCLAAMPLLAQNIPLDPQLRTGKLSNGFTYYIRHNEQPKKHVELYLVNKVGSILEDDDQQGLAHFMEHMNFNGTKNFPKNDLVDFLQHAGVRFGADLNAYTSFDETVYKLPIPTDDPAMFGNGIKIMRDWAQEATLEPVEIEKERGVVLEEERLGKGASDRLSRKYYPMLLNHSRYAERLPIGKDEILTKFRPEVIKRYHHDWYRPDLQALIIVGDIDVNEAEKMVKAKFSDLKTPDNERKRINYKVPLLGTGQFLTATDREETSTGLQVMFKHNGNKLVTEQDYFQSIKQNLLNEMLNDRRTAEMTKEPNPAFTGVSMGISNLLNNVDMFSFSVSAKEGMLKEAFSQGWSVFEQISKYGFTENELNRARKNYLRNLESSMAEENKTPSLSYVTEYQRLFLHREASPGIKWEYDFTKQHIAGITISDMGLLLKNDLDVKDVDVLITAPEKDKASLPDSATVQQWMAAVQNGNIHPYKDELVSQPLIAHKPMPGKVVKSEAIAGIGATKLTLSNGVKVILKPTNFKNDQILYGAFAPGGTSLYDQEDYDAAVNAGALISHFGLAGLTPVQLTQLLTGKSVNSVANIGNRSETISAASDPKDIETALQVTYLQFTEPRKDSMLFKNTISDGVASLANRGQDPNKVFADTVSYVMGNYNFRSAPVTIERLNKINLNRVYQIYKERFADASSFTFVFVGNFDIKKLTPLIEQYLGSLPSTHSGVKARDMGVHIPSGRIVKKVYKGTEDKALVRMVFSGDYSYSPLSNLELRALGDILQIKVLQQLREAESEVYSPQVQSIYNKYPTSRFALVVSFGCAPKNVDHLCEVLEKEIDNLRTNGPDQDDIVKFKAQYQKNVELVLQDNSFWYTYLLGQAENQESFLEVNTAKSNLDKIDAASLKKAAETFLSRKNVLQFDLLPENK